MTSTIHVQMWDHGDQRASHVIDGGEEEMISLVWMQSERSKANHTNFVRLTHRIPMAQVEDLPEAMQRQVVGVPRAWVRLFRWLARAVVTYHDHNPHPSPQD